LRTIICDKDMTGPRELGKFPTASSTQNFLEITSRSGFHEKVSGNSMSGAFSFHP
jgi:hypothetical protein